MNQGPESIDYQESSDVTEVHAATRREHRDPSAEVTPIPLWLTALCGVAVCWAGVYLGVFHGGFSGNIYNEYESSPAALFPLPTRSGGESSAAAVQTLAQAGKSVYAQQCVSCHQGTGLGLPGQYPPLAKSEFVLGGEKRLLAILLKGLQGPVTVEGKLYNNAMPPWISLGDKKVAAVASYIRSEWGNSAPEITPEKVAAARKEFEAQAAQWTEAQLLQIPADANFTDVGPAPTAAPAAGGKTPAAPASGAAPAAVPAAAGAAPAAAGDADVLAAGKAGYMTICIVCHQATGLGMPAIFPPLTKSEYVSGDPKRFAAMVLKGIAGPITIEGKPYNNMMPAQEALLTDDKIAAILSFVRSSFGNSAPIVSPDVVAAARKEFIERKTPWTEAELKAFGGAPAPTPAPAQ